MAVKQKRVKVFCLGKNEFDKKEKFKHCDSEDPWLILTPEALGWDPPTSFSFNLGNSNKSLPEPAWVGRFSAPGDGLSVCLIVSTALLARGTAPDQAWTASPVGHLLDSKPVFL
jgi:hypothetical protein